MNWQQNWYAQQQEERSKSSLTDNQMPKIEKISTSKTQHFFNGGPRQLGLGEHSGNVICGVMAAEDAQVVSTVLLGNSRIERLDIDLLAEVRCPQQKVRRH